MSQHSFRIIFGVILAAIIIGCGGGGGSDNDDSNALQAPRPGDPAFGIAGQARISDRGLTPSTTVNTLWVGFANPEDWARFQAALEHATSNNSLPWVGGQVVVDEDQPLGFLFDPTTATGAEVVGEGVQIPLDRLIHDPAAAQAAGHPWYVAAVVEQVIPGTAAAGAP